MTNTQPIPSTTAVSEPTFELTDTIPTIEIYARESLTKFGPGTWETDNLLKLSKGNINFSDKTLTVTGKELIDFIQEMKKIKEMNDATKITSDIIKKSVFASDSDLFRKMNGVQENFTVFTKLDEEFGKLKINRVFIQKNLSMSKAIEKDLTIYFQPQVNEECLTYQPPSGYYQRISSILFSKLKTDFTIESELDNAMYKTNWLKGVEGEKVDKIEFNGITVGHYYRNRNIILMYFNPFRMKKLTTFQMSYNDIWTEVFNMIKALKPKKEKIDDLKFKIFISSFLKEGERKLVRLTQEKDNKYGEIQSYEKAIRDQFTRLREIEFEKSYLEQALKSNGDTVIKELKKIEKIPFVEKSSISHDGISILFKPATVTSPNFRRDGKSFGRRTFYIGSVEVKLRAGEFYIQNELSLEGHPHPHASNNSPSNPCFGDGEGRQKIYELQSKFNFADLTKMLWIWVKTFRNDSAYLHENNMYDSLLKQGYPVWDEKGNRIEFNDPERIKSGEQYKDRTKEENYEDNIKTFKDMKMF